MGGLVSDKIDEIERLLKSTKRVRISYSRGFIVLESDDETSARLDAYNNLVASNYKTIVVEEIQ